MSQGKTQEREGKWWIISTGLWISQKVSQLAFYSQVRLPDDFSEKNNFNSDAKCVSITK